MIGRFRNYYLLLFLLVPSFLFAQKGASTPVFDFSPDQAGLEELLTYVLQANRKERIALSHYLEPDETVCHAVFDFTYAKEIFRYQRRLQKLAHIVVQPLQEEQTDFLCWTATTEELLDYTGEARYFPGGYHEIANFMMPGVRFYRVKFVQPGRKIGTAFDIWVHVNGKWNLIHRPWVVLFE